MTDQPASLPAVLATDLEAAPPDTLAPEIIVGPPRREVWTNIGHPFASGLLLTIGGLVAIALGLAFINLSTIVIYIVLALFVALALNPVVERLSRRRMSRTWAIVIVYAIFGHSPHDLPVGGAARALHTGGPVIQSIPDAHRLVPEPRTCTPGCRPPSAPRSAPS